MSASGTLTRKIECQPNTPVSTPPNSGPTAAVDNAASERKLIAARGGSHWRRSA